MFKIQLSVSHTDHMPGGPGHMAEAAGEGGQGGPIKADKTHECNLKSTQQKKKSGVTQHQAMLDNLDIDFDSEKS